MNPYLHGYAPALWVQISFEIKEKILNFFLQLNYKELQNNEISKQGYHFVGNDQFSGVFWGPDDQ